MKCCSSFNCWCPVLIHGFGNVKLSWTFNRTFPILTRVTDVFWNHFRFMCAVTAVLLETSPSPSCRSVSSRFYSVSDLLCHQFETFTTFDLVSCIRSVRLLPSCLNPLSFYTSATGSCNSCPTFHPILRWSTLKRQLSEINQHEARVRESRKTTAFFQPSLFPSRGIPKCPVETSQAQFVT
jgi:hypothetical protein